MLRTDFREKCIIVQFLVAGKIRKYWKRSERRDAEALRRDLEKDESRSEAGGGF